MILIKEKTIILYSTGCPRCEVLKKKLDTKGVGYEENTNTEEMLCLGISEVPVLRVDDVFLSFAEAVKWVSAQ